MSQLESPNSTPSELAGSSDPVESMVGKDHPKRNRIPWQRKLLFLLIVLGLIEGGAWIADSILGFRSRLVTGLDRMLPNNEPIDGAKKTLASEDPIIIRDPKEPIRRNRRPHTIGGHIIPNASRDVDVTVLPPGDSLPEAPPRIFILGGSAAMGYLYPYPHTFAGMIQEQFGEEAHVSNTGMMGLTSGELVPIAERLVEKYSPTTFVLFVGNNEWVHYDPPGRNRAVLTLMRRLSISRTMAAAEFYLLDRTMRGTGQRGPSDIFQMHRELYGAGYALAHPADPAKFDAQAWLKTKAEYLQVFEKNLSAIIELAQENDVDVVLMTVPFNYRMSPAWKHPQPESFDPQHADAVNKHLEAAVTATKNDDVEAALNDLDSALKLDPLPPILHYLRGNCLEVLNRPLEAEKAFAQSREHMVGNLGGRLSINKVIERVGKNYGVPVVDLKKRFDEVSHATERYFNADLIHDDCHPTPRAHRLIADELYPLLVERQKYVPEKTTDDQ